MARAQDAITFADIGQTFTTRTGPLTALSGVDIAIKRHEFVAVLGPSGCGKSTLLRLTAGLVKPTAGTVSVFGMPVTQPRDDVGIVFQQATLFPWATVEDNVAFPAKHMRGRISKQDREVAQDVIADYKVPLGRPRDENTLRATEIQDLATELRDLLIAKETV